MSGLVLKNVNKIYPGGQQSVKDFSLEIRDREFLILVGPAGCGKSALLRMIGGLDEISSGSLFIDGKDMTDADPKDRNIAMLFKNSVLYPGMTVEDNLSFALRMGKMAQEEIDRRIREISGYLKLSDILDKKPEELTGEETYRALLGRAMMRRPGILLLDSTIADLEESLQKVMRKEFKEIHKKMDMTVVYVTDKVFTPLDYRTVMGPAKIDSLNSIFNQAMADAQFVYYLRSLKSTYQFFVTPNEYMKDYVDPVAKSYASENYRCNLEFQLTPQNTVAAVPTRTSDGTVIMDNGFPLGSNGTVSNSSILKNRLEDILNCQTLVTESNEAFEAARAGGQEYFITKGYAPVRITQDNKISGAGNERPLTVSKIYNKENGNTYLIDGILQNTTTSIYDVLSSKDDFREFYDMCALLGIFVNNPTSSTVAPGRKVKFLNQYHYTVYVPTNEAIREAQAKGWIPTVEQIENEGDQSVRDSLENVMERFVRYHFQDNSVFIKGEKVENKAYLTSTINEASNKFYPVYVTNKDGNITLVDEADYGTGRVSARVVKTEGVYNLMTRDMTLNSGDKEKATTIEAYTYAVIHQIDDVLWFEQPKGGNAKDQK